jgi:hypothetical protein
MRRSKLLGATALLVFATACSTETDPADTTVGDDDTGGAEESDTGTDEVPANWIPALGIDIVEVEANQGTRVVIGGPDGEWVDGANRNTYLLSDRDTLIRVHFTVADGWEAHDIKAVLTVQAPGGEPSIHEQEIEVTGDSSPTALNRTFYFGLVAELGETLPGTTYQVELFAKDTEQDPAMPQGDAINPAAGPNQIGLEDTPLQMKVMLVPIHYTGDGKDLLPDLTDENVAKLIDGLYEQNPTREVIWQIRPQPVEYTNYLSQLGSLLPMMSATKQNDAADPNLYYHALINTGCFIEDCASSGTVGIANLASDSKQDSLSRVAASIWYEVDSTADTFVHEVGHNQGFSHVACPGADAAGPDPSYPYADGKIGNWGFGIRGFSLHNPTAAHDYMSYCGNTWVSDWRWSKAYSRIRTLTSWDLGAAPAEPDPNIMGSEVLVGAMYPDGTEEWFVLDGGVDLEETRPGEGVEFVVGGQAVARPAVVRTMSDDATQWVMVPMPDGVDLADVASMTHVRDGQTRRVIAPAQVRANPATTIKAP